MRTQSPLFWSNYCCTDDITAVDIAREDTFHKGIQNRSQALRHFLRDDWFTDQQDSSEAFLLTAGPNAKQRPVKVRDFYDQDCRSFLLFEVDNDEDLWKLLSRPVCVDFRSHKAARLLTR